MKRRKFIINAALGSLGLYFAGGLYSCSGYKSSLEGLLNLPESTVSSGSYVFKQEGKGFTYYVFNQSDIESGEYDGEKVFVYCKNGMIVGFTVEIEGNDSVDKMIEKLNKTYGKSKKVYANDFGTEYQWKNGNKIIKLSYNNYKKLPKLTFYSNFINNAGLIL